MPLTKMDHALDAASRNLPVFPQVLKRPSIRDWPNNATLKESVIRRWWTRWPDADIGIALPADIYVLDADGDDALFALGGLRKPVTLEIQTARGVHLYFRAPYPLARMTPDGSRSGVHAIEGKGSPGPVTWAGSVHHTGHVYTVTVDAPIAPMTHSMAAAIGRRKPRTSNGEATPDERLVWDLRASLAAGSTRPIVVDAVTDAQADLRLVLRELHSELPHMTSGWADRLFRSAAYLGPHVATGALGLDTAIKELTALFHELDQEGRDPGHALRSIERGVAAGARAADKAAL